MSHQSLQALTRLSARIGNDPHLSQGAGGNTSVKIGDVLWVKASGKWLAAAADEPIFVPVTLSGVRRRVAANETDPVSAEVVTTANASGLRPSIEATLHALMPHAVVLHVHSVNTLAWAVRQDGEDRLVDRLRGLKWAWVPYCRPGVPLTHSVAGVLQSREADILIMANHGLLVGGSDCSAAEALLAEVESRLRLAPRPAPAPDIQRLASLAAGTAYRLPKHASGHGVATDPLSLRIALGGTLYPDHVVFLGPGAVALQPEEILAALERRRADAGHATPPLVLVPGVGALVHESLSVGGEEMVLCLALVTERIPADAPIAYLSDVQNAELLNWDAEKYRRSLAR